MSFYNKEPLEAPLSTNHTPELLKSVNAEIDFNRRRAGQVFFFGLLFEILILAGRDIENVQIPHSEPWMAPLIYTIFFAAVAGVGIALGTEYRRRIRYLKQTRLELVNHLKYDNVYPTDDTQNASEIQVLYVVLTFLSSCGCIFVWLISTTTDNFVFTTRHKIMYIAFLVLGFCGFAYSSAKVIYWLIKHLIKIIKQKRKTPQPELPETVIEQADSQE